MTLWCFDDAFGRARWGRDLHAAAIARGWDARLFTQPVEAGEGYAFFRMYHDPAYLPTHRRIMAALCKKPDLVTIPEERSAVLYDDKLAQTHALGKWMPKTRILTTLEAAEAALEAMRFPFVSKSKGGASAQNVRLIRNRRQARTEAAQVFSRAGLPIFKGQTQRGYLIWQDFLKGNDFDYRVIAVGRQRFMFRRFNRADVPFASGSGDIEAVWDPVGDAADALELAEAFFNEEGFTWCGIDLVRDPRAPAGAESWRVLETTVAWMLQNYAEGRFIGSGRPVPEIWDVLLDEIEAGVFAA